MRLLVFIFCLAAINPVVFGSDDSDRYKVAKFYKKKAQNAVDKSPQLLKGECRIMLTMDYLNRHYAKLKRIRTNGSSQVCKIAAKELKQYKEKKISYDTPEKLLRITVSSRQ